MVTLVPSYASIRPDESGPHVGLHGPGTQLNLRLSWIEWLWFPQGAHPILVTVFLFYASPGSSDYVPHLGLHGPSDSGPHPGIIGPGYSIPQLDLTLTRDLWSLSEPQTKLVTLVPPLGLTLTW